jgi:hypothetical protein
MAHAGFEKYGRITRRDASELALNTEGSHSEGGQDTTDALRAPLDPIGPAVLLSTGYKGFPFLQALLVFRFRSSCDAVRCSRGGTDCGTTNGHWCSDRCCGP